MNTANASSPTCYAEYSSDSVDETIIFCGDAKDVHHICVRHGKMATNGELRFRLRSLKDGSAYIRTQTTGESEGWQRSHYHKQLRETYIVERGWIGYAELEAKSPRYMKFCPGDVFTTSPEVRHNIYMSANSVIHTVKHSGGSPGTNGKEDWHQDEECELLSLLVGKGFPDDVHCTTHTSGQTSRDPEKTYNAAYRHFDTLIWQVPAWSSALFAAIVASVNSFLTPASAQPTAAALPPSSSNAVVALLRLSTEAFAAVQIGFFGLFTLALAYALYRFRWHQIGVRGWRNTSTSPRYSPQTYLQLLVHIEAGLLLFVALALAGLPQSAVGVALLLVVGWMFFRWESSIRGQATPPEPPKTSAAAPHNDNPISGAS